MKIAAWLAAWFLACCALRLVESFSLGFRLRWRVSARLLFNVHTMRVGIAPETLDILGSLEDCRPLHLNTWNRFRYAAFGKTPGAI
jgi:hypothetical protein